MKKFLNVLLGVVLISSTFLLSFGSEASAAAMKDIPGSPGWKYRVDKPHVDGVNNDWHVHVQKGKINGAERVTGGKSHGKTLTSAGVPKSVQKNVKKTKDFQKGVDKQEKLDKERKKASQLTWNQILLKPSAIIAIAAAVGLTVGKLLLHPKLIFG
ncbi:hypothetical protein [Kurthia gibsonii]|uniref:hypothetical protein n=1 Tax=Kurthia gibsonii TaxID=33946 RepID=UPI002DBB9162|nr:hypothetical protein [Kurthia gibsonii]MEB7773559.1 hypothetical protein [Kurthia gibsonii]